MIKTPREKLISSDANPIFRTLLELHSGKGIRKHGQFLLFGERVVREALDSKTAGAPVVRSLIAVDGDPIGDYQRKLPPEAGVLRLTKPLFEALDLFGARAPILACETPVIKEWSAEAPQGLELLLALSDPSNLGACLRAAAAFGASKVVLLRECANPFHPRASRAASGSLLATPLQKGPSIQDVSARLESQRGPAGVSTFFALDMSGKLLPDVSWPKGARLLLGEEGQGVPKDVLAQRVAIPMTAGAESLNAASALAVALYAWKTARR